MTRSTYRYVGMAIEPDPGAAPYTVRATCATCGERSPDPEAEGPTGQHSEAQRWCRDHAAHHHPDGRHLHYTATVTYGWQITPTEDIGPAADHGSAASSTPNSPNTLVRPPSYPKAVST
ncbi:DUF7848 domain-containing protein [Streptomyces zagrosensis]|uniref:DUF7848 domain-containing protein n=1 Tax=Streptomyces zagrosensis TaxID=1042984 RepID=A0A7W9QFM3_9ACTN|nr:hypothetical protein [Streptomyces zagrosensis]MBB5939368.1 hypothetical protein [Streptomyces zagrosensis]